MKKNKKYWDERSKYYNNLEWVHSKLWLNSLISFSEIKKEDFTLDLGTGTGVIANAISKLCKKVIASDISEGMINHSVFDENILPVLFSIEEEKYFENDYFDKIISRMCFHHLTDVKSGMDNCMKILKPKGKLIISESLPPTDEENVVEWWTEMFSLKEDRIVFTLPSIIKYFERSNYKNVEYKEEIDTNFDVLNWINNQGLPQETKDKIISMHLNAPDFIKKAHNIRILDDQILLNSRILLIKGEK